MEERCRNCNHDDKPDLRKNRETFTTVSNRRGTRTNERTNECTPKREMRDFEIKLPLLAVTRKARSAPIAMIKPPPLSVEKRNSRGRFLLPHNPGPGQSGFLDRGGTRANKRRPRSNETTRRIGFRGGLKIAGNANWPRSSINIAGL